MDSTQPRPLNAKREPARCEVDDCAAPVRSRGMCTKHYCRWAKYGDVTKTFHRTGCSVPDCSREHHAKGYCSMHHLRWKKWGDPQVTYGHHPPTSHRFWSKVNKQGSMPPQSVAPGLCWEWIGAKTPGGYGQFWLNPKKVVSHRFAYEQLVGEIPEGLQLDHLCRNRACVNPEHLEPVTQQVNILRGFSIATANRLKTHCPHGHLYSAENTYIHPKNNGRICRACARKRSRANYQKRKIA